MTSLREIHVQKISLQNDNENKTLKDKTWETKAIKQKY